MCLGWLCQYMWLEIATAIEMMSSWMLTTLADVMHKLQAGHIVLESRMTIRGQEKSDAALLLQQSAYCLKADTVPTYSTKPH